MCPGKFFRSLLLLLILWNVRVNSVVFGLSKDYGSPDVVEVENGPPGVVWVVQMSDIHISKWVPERGHALRKSLGRALKIINPAVVLVSGDLTGTRIPQCQLCRLLSIFLESNIGSFLHFFSHCASGTVASSHCVGIGVMEMLLKCDNIINLQKNMRN